MMAKIIAAFVFFSPLLFEGKWEKDGISKGGITVWTRSVEGSAIKQVKASTTIKAHPDKVWEGLMDREKFLKVMPFVIEDKTIEKCGDTCKITYQIIHRPPLKDRGYLLKVTWVRKEDEQGNVTINHKWVKAPGKTPPGKLMDVVSMYGKWDLSSDDNNETTKFTYTSYLDMGGLVPSGLVNSSLNDNAFNFLKNLRTAAPKW